VRDGHCGSSQLCGKKFYMKKAVPPWAGRLIYIGVTSLAFGTASARRGGWLRLFLFL
jgi:hypothetical protein